jgi:type I restriction enzyme S subunit
MAMNFEPCEQESYALRQGDVLVTEGCGSPLELGASARWNNDIAGTVAFQNTLLRLRARPGISDPAFLYLLARWCQSSGAWLTASSGTSILHIGHGRAKRILVPAPPLDNQRKIGFIVSAYDELIENNNRRIKLLEEMAQRIYREWFVDFRYRGHEAVPLVDSELGLIPKGWIAAPLFEVAEVTFGYPFKSELFNGACGLPVIRIRDIPNGESGTLTPEEPSGIYRVSDGDILIGMDGNFHMGRWSAGEAWLNQRVTRLRVTSRAICRYALFLALEKPIGDWNQAIVGTTVAHLGKSHLELIKIPVPPLSLGMQLSALLDPMFELEITLRKVNRNLRKARDVLIPRLISGEIVVTDLDIALAETAA